jgi:hypothetical protein
MEPNQGEQSTKSTPKVAAAIPMPWNGNMDDNPYNNKRAIFQSPSTAVPSLSFYNNNKNHNYAGYGFPHSHAYCGYPGKRVISYICI